MQSPITDHTCTKTETASRSMSCSGIELLWATVLSHLISGLGGLTTVGNKCYHKSPIITRWRPLIWLWHSLWLSHLTVTHRLSFCYQQHFLSLPPHLIELGNNLCNSQIHNCPQISLSRKLTEPKVSTAVSDSCCPQLWAVTAVSNITSMWTV